MYQSGDTIAAISSPAEGGRVIIRISGPKAVPAASDLFKPKLKNSHKKAQKENLKNLHSGISFSRAAVDSQTLVDAKIYFFRSPHSYTGEDIIEIHLYANRQVCDALMERLLSPIHRRCRQAGPGEFTARSFLNGKIDLSQAEAVSQIISGSNKFQIDSAEKLLSGRLTDITEKICRELLDCLSLLEAGLDFSEETIEFISPQANRQVVQRLKKAKGKLDDLLAGAISYEITAELPSVGIAGAPNAGKSSLFNRLLGEKRSIVSGMRKTTRDILTGTMIIDRNRCVLFDCAGLLERPRGIIERLSGQAAIEGLNNCNVVIFCVDASKSIEDFAADVRVRNLIKPKSVLLAATKADLLSGSRLSKSRRYLRKVFGADFLSVSSKTGFGIEQLKKTIDRKIVASVFGTKVRSGQFSALQDMAALTSRHKQAVRDSAESIKQAGLALKENNCEIASMFIRSAVQELGGIGSAAGGIDEQVLDRIFSTFCVGK